MYNIHIPFFISFILLTNSPMSAHSPLGIKDAVSPASAANWKSNCRKYVQRSQTIFSFIIIPDLEAVVSPASKLHVTVLVIEGEPSYVNGARGHEDARGDVGAETLTRDHHIGGVGCVKCLTGAVKSAKYSQSSDKAANVQWQCNPTLVHRYAGWDPNY